MIEGGLPGSSVESREERGSVKTTTSGVRLRSAAAHTNIAVGGARHRSAATTRHPRPIRLASSSSSRALSSAGSLSTDRRHIHPATTRGQEAGRVLEAPQPRRVPRSGHERARRVLEVRDGRRDVVVRGERRLRAHGAPRVKEASRRSMDLIDQTK
jgi:hypothetical protein